MGQKLTKKQILATLKGMPDTFESIDLMDRLVLMTKVSEGQKQLKTGKGVTSATAKKKLKKWVGWLITCPI